ncbi:MAG: DegT/DnrJ/EryC1/StrS family aminotransferase [Candidatus Bipolaricaulia bacterium]
MRPLEIPLARPEITELEIAAVEAVLRTPNLSLGPKLEEFERRLASYVGVKHGVAVNSGTSALHLIIKALGIGAGDEVITTPFSFIASANCILFERAFPVFVDIDPRTLNIDPERIEERVTERTKAILAVDVFGQPADWAKLEKIAARHGLLLIEDSAEALGAEFKGRKAGSFGKAGVFGFYPNKQITTGEGGMILTDDDELAQLCRSLRNQGRGEDEGQGQGWHRHERLGYNYRLSELNCALGLAQLSRLEEILRKRERVAQMYNERLKGVEGLEIPYVSPDVKMSWFVYVVRLSEDYSSEDRARILWGLKARGIGCSDYFPPIHLQPFYRELGYREGDYPITERVASRTIALPFYNNLTEREVDYVVQSLKELLSGSTR